MKQTAESPNKKTNFFSHLKRFIRHWKKTDHDASLRETIEELIEDTVEDIPSIESDERLLLENVLDLRESTAYDIMTPRADFTAVSSALTGQEILEIFVRSKVSWLVIYKENLDNVIGTIHAKDMLCWLHSGDSFNLNQWLKEVMFISPAMRTLDLLIMMRKSHIKLAIVVDEYGGVDGLVTFQQLIEEVIGDIEDSSQMPTPQLNWRSDGAVLADGRSTIEELDELVGGKLNLIKEDDDIETLNGLVIYLAGRVPVRGEVIKHENQMEFEILDADPRYVKRLCVRNIPLKQLRKASAVLSSVPSSTP